MVGPEERNALGRLAAIGTCYDARKDEFLLPAGSVFVPEHAQPEITNVSSTSIKVDFSHTYEQTLNTMGVQLDLAASVASGFAVALGWQAVFLADFWPSDLDHELTAMVHHTHVSVEESLPGAKFSGSLDSQKLASATDATHVVVGVKLGCLNMGVVRLTIPFGMDRAAMEKSFRDQVMSLERPEGQHSSSLSEDIEITIRGDFLAEPGLVVADLEEASEFFRLSPTYMKHTQQGKCYPMVYSMLPVSFLSMLARIPGSVGTVTAPVPRDNLNSVVRLFDELQTIDNKVEKCRVFLCARGNLVDEKETAQTLELLDALTHAKADFKAKYASLLFQSEAVFRRRIRVAHEGIELVELEQPKLATISSLVRKGAIDLSRTTAKLVDVLSDPRKINTYVVYLRSIDIRNDPELWTENQELINSITRGDTVEGEATLHEKPTTRRSSSRLSAQKHYTEEREGNFTVVVVDCDSSSSQGRGRTHISLHMNYRETVPDLLERNNFRAGKCFVHCIPETLETTDVQRPPKRHFVSIPCPRADCDSGQEQEWLCPRCLVPIEFGYSDHFIYCVRGRSLYSNFTFKCSSKRHGQEPARYPDEQLLELLRKLGDSDTVNIFILVEAGVGKSAFINALINYLTYDTLTQAMDEDLKWVIPCSFAVQTMNRSDTSEGEIEEYNVKVGARDDEEDGSKGASATQKTQVHSFALGTRTIRLIETPGICDTRGLAFDEKNTEDILGTLRGYDDLHGILILLKPNNAPLTVTFNFCMKELLTHLHKSAAANMAFGFTNAKLSNYTPGDTFGPLKTLMDEHPNIGLRLTSHTTYCFDSESFRYLAAFKNGHTLLNFDDFARSWDHSRDEAHRLVDYFKARTPHKVQNTISLNKARQLIQELTKPMAEVSRVIQENVALCEDKKEELKNHRLSGKDLKKRLWVRKIQFEAVKLLYPRTVCSNVACVEYKDDGTGTNTQATIYKTHCHPQCGVRDVQVDQIAHPGIRKCSSMGKTDSCVRKCGHHWQEHLHVLYELEPRTVIVTDEAIQTQLKMHADDETLRQTALETVNKQITEYQDEHQAIREASAQFGLFLKKHSITPYNDTTLAYIDILIKGEQININAAQERGIPAQGNEKRLQALEDDKRQHLELVTALSDSDLNSMVPASAGEVDNMVHELYQLKHFGGLLQRCKDTVVSAHEATYRKQPIRVRKPGCASSRSYSSVASSFSSNHHGLYSGHMQQGQGTGYGYRDYPPSRGSAGQNYPIRYDRREERGNRENNLNSFWKRARSIFSGN